MTKEVPQDMQDVINEVSTTTSGRGDLANEYKVWDTIIEDSLKDANVDVTITGQPITTNATVQNVSVPAHLTATADVAVTGQPISTNASLQSTSVAYNSTYKAFDVLPQDAEYIGFNLYLTSTLATTTLASNASLDATTVVVTSATGITTGKAINIKQDNRFFQSLVTNVAGTTITIASPLDFAFTTGATVRVGDWNLNQNGSVTPVVFKLQPPPNAKFHITAISITMTDDATMDNSKFGSLTALTKGLLARRADGTKANLFLITNNAGFYQYGYTTDYPAKVPAGVYSFQARKLVKDINGNVIALNGVTNDEVQIIVRDDLTALSEFTVQMHGHIIED